MVIGRRSTYLPKEKTHGGSIQSEGHYELFNLKEDPFESKNLASTLARRVEADAL